MVEGGQGETGMAFEDLEGGLFGGDHPEEGVAESGEGDREDENNYGGGEDKTFRPGKRMVDPIPDEDGGEENNGYSKAEIGDQKKKDNRINNRAADAVGGSGAGCTAGGSGMAG